MNELCIDSKMVIVLALLYRILSLLIPSCAPPSILPSYAPSSIPSPLVSHILDQGSCGHILAGRKRKGPSISMDEAVGTGHENSVVGKKRKELLLTQGILLERSASQG